MLGFVARRVFDPHLAADLTADIFLAALAGADRFDPARATPRAWLYGIAKNTIAMHRRGSSREHHATTRLGGHRPLDACDITALEERIDAERAAANLLFRNAALPDSLREVLDLLVVDGLSTRETAQVLGITQTTVRVRLHRARKFLRATTPTAPRPILEAT